MQFIDCTHCRSRHTDRYLCDPVKLLLDAMLKRGESLDTPTLTFPEHLPDLTIGAPGDVLLAQLVIKGASVELQGGVRHPAVIMTGRAVDGTVLPQWIHTNTDEQLRKSARLLHEMTELAIRKAT